MTCSLQVWFELIFVSILLSLFSCCEEGSDLEKLKEYGTFYSERQILDFLEKHRRYSYIDESLKEYHLLRLTDEEIKHLVKRWPLITVEAFHKPYLEKLKEYGTFYSERQILDFLEKHRRYSYIDESLKEYHLLRLTDEEIKHLVKRWPLITVEAFHKPLRGILGGKLAARLAGKMISLTEQAFKRYKIENFTEVVVRRGLHALLSYLTSYKLRSVLQDSFAIVAGYWIDQVSFNIARLFHETLPPEGSPVYEWPKDLLKPDLIFYINAPQTDTNLSEEQKQNLTVFKKKLATVFRRWKTPKVVELNATSVYHILVDDMIYHINRELKNNYLFKLQIRYTRS